MRFNLRLTEPRCISAGS